MENNRHSSEINDTRHNRRHGDSEWTYRRTIDQNDVVFSPWFRRVFAPLPPHRHGIVILRFLNNNLPGNIARIEDNEFRGGH